MSVIAPQDLLDQMRWRYATKRFDPSRKIDPQLWQRLEEALVLSPSSFGLQLWKFVVVTDPELKKRLRPLSWNQPQVEEASHLVVLASRTSVTAGDVDHYLDRIVELRGVTRESLEGYRDMMLKAVVTGIPEPVATAWAARQIYIALGVLCTSAALLGVDACPMEGFDMDKYDEVLGLKELGYHAGCMVALGYRSPEDGFAAAPKVRFKAEDVLIHK